MEHSPALTRVLTGQEKIRAQLCALEKQRKVQLCASNKQREKQREEDKEAFRRSLERFQIRLQLKFMTPLLLFKKEKAQSKEDRR